ncbi:hypothetical protein PGTUg99_033080 [Puccinia graminis f. sp. tritici]|uniref:Uncharacterized protein n=1 Tax=Puccinia graminis f. sp. tritici TaxID=56615 RepID=A0A5B0R7Q4_PUCGR|nr:hypothetical protein PGTUg99_033080 [Puccinia graminis f. sp. tritici]
MSHTVNPHQPRLGTAHPSVRGLGGSMLPPSQSASQIQSHNSNSSRPASRQTGQHHIGAGTPILPPHLQTGQGSINSTATSVFAPHDQGGFLGDQGAFEVGYEPVGNNLLDPLSNHQNHLNNSNQLGPANFQQSRYQNRLPETTQQPALVDMIDHDALQEIFGLSEARLASTHTILEMTPANITASLVYGMQSVLDHIQSLPPQVTPEIPQQVANAEAPADIRNFMYSDYIKEDIRDFTRRRLIEARLVAYSRQNDNDGVALPGALISLTQAHVARLPRNIVEQHLPAGFSQGDMHAHRSVLGMVRDVLKHTRVTLRNLLLKNIINTSLTKVTGAAPCLEVLFNTINQAFFANAGIHVPPVIWRNLPIGVKVRFAYLRLETAAYALQPPQGHGSQWTLIDNHLQFLSTQSMDYIRAWADLILRKDVEMFGLGGSIYASVKHLPHLPTHEDVLAHEEAGGADALPDMIEVGKTAISRCADGSQLVSQRTLLERPVGQRDFAIPNGCSPNVAKTPTPETDRGYVRLDCVRTLPPEQGGDVRKPVPPLIGGTFKWVVVYLGLPPALGGVFWKLGW